jgi:hypothetical protein
MLPFAGRYRERASHENGRRIRGCGDASLHRKSLPRAMLIPPNIRPRPIRSIDADETAMAKANRTIPAGIGISRCGPRDSYVIRKRILRSSLIRLRHDSSSLPPFGGMLKNGENRAGGGCA